MGTVFVPFCSLAKVLHYLTTILVSTCGILNTDNLSLNPCVLYDIGSFTFSFFSVRMQMHPKLMWKMQNGSNMFPSFSIQKLSIRREESKKEKIEPNYLDYF